MRTNPTVIARKLARAKAIASRCKEADVKHLPAWVYYLLYVKPRQKTEAVA